MAELLGAMDVEQELVRAEVESVSDYASVCPNGANSNSNVQVVVRVRPPSGREKEQGYSKCVGVDSVAHSLTLHLRPQPRTFTFDYVADEAVNQEEIFYSVGKPITDACLQGYHCCLIAYGQTGAGKTFTMEGPDSDLHASSCKAFGDQSNFFLHEKHGLIPRILHYIFQSITADKMQGVNEVEYVLKCSYLQIYNEQVSDLLDPGSTNLTIHEDAKHGMYVEGLQEVVVSTPAATYAVFRRGSENRHVGMTAMNMESSRSHSVFTLVVESQRRNDGGVMNRRTSRFYLVDLAGSERQKHSESAGIRLKEAGSINKSLSALGNVIKALVDISEGKIRHVPYRDSKLTFLLKDALGGNSKCTLVANVSPAEKNLDETLSTLKFAQRAKLMLNTAVVNEDMFGNPAVMGEEIRRLRLEIAFLRASVGSGVAVEQISLPAQEMQSESTRVNRLEHIISQSTKRQLATERKTASELSELSLRLEAVQAICERLDKTLQSHKMIIRLRENRIKRVENGSLTESEEVQDLKEEIECLRKQIEHHPDVVRFKMELDLCKAQLDDYQNGRKDEDSLQSQIDQVENLNQAMRIELQDAIDDKASLTAELAEMKSERDAVKSQLVTMEEQFLKLREAVDKYRQEAEEAIFRQARAEEKLRDSTNEQNEVWRRCNLAEAQATELAQELALQKSQGEKMTAAFREQSRLQEDMFLELQNATQGCDESAKALADKEKLLAETILSKLDLEAQLQSLESERRRISGSLDEMATSFEHLAATIEDKNAMLLELKSQLDVTDANLKATQASLSAALSDKESADQARLLAVQGSVELAEKLENVTREKGKMESLVGEAEQKQEEAEKLAHGLLAEMSKTISEKEDAIMNRTTEVWMQVDACTREVEEKIEELTVCVYGRAEKLEQDILSFSGGLEEQLAKLAACKEYAEAQSKSLEERNNALQGENLGLHETICNLQLKEQEQRQVTLDLQRKLDDVLLQHEATSQQLLAITAEHQTSLLAFSEKHVLDSTINRGATPTKEERIAPDSGLAHATNIVANNASKETDMKFVADRDESSPLDCQVRIQEKVLPSSIVTGEVLAQLKVDTLPGNQRQLGPAYLTSEKPCETAKYGEHDGSLHPDEGFTASTEEVVQECHPPSPPTIHIVHEKVSTMQFHGNMPNPMEWTLSVQGIAPKLSLPAFKVDSQNIGLGQLVGKAEARGNIAAVNRFDEQQRQLVLLDMNRQVEDIHLQLVRREQRIPFGIKEPFVEDPGLTLGASLTENDLAQGRFVDGCGQKESRNEGLKYLSDLVKSAMQEIECQLRKHAARIQFDREVPEVSTMVLSSQVTAPGEDFQKNLAKYKETVSLWENSRQQWEADLVFMKNEMAQIEGFRSAYEDLIPRLEQLVSAGEELMSASEQSGMADQTSSTICSSRKGLEMEEVHPHMVFRGNTGRIVGPEGNGSRMIHHQHAPAVRSLVQRSSSRPSKTIRKVGVTKFSGPMVSVAPGGANMFQSACDKDDSRNVQMPTTAPPQTKVTMPPTVMRPNGGGAAMVRRPLQPIHGNTCVGNRVTGSKSGVWRKKPRPEQKVQPLQQPLPSLPEPKGQPMQQPVPNQLDQKPQSQQHSNPASPKCSHKRRRLI